MIVTFSQGITGQWSGRRSQRPGKYVRLRLVFRAQAMNPEGEDMFSRTLRSQSDIPVFNAFVLSWLQVQFVASDGSG